MNGSILFNGSVVITGENLTDVDSDTEGWLAANKDVLIVLDALALFNTFATMFFMGCDITWEQIKGTLNFRKYLVLGLAGQYLLMPLCGYLVIYLFGIGGWDAAGVTIITCSPGGGYSNLLTYLFDGEVWLSVTLTAISSFIAFGTMPLNLWIYGGDGTLSVPYLQMFIALVLLNVFVFLGMLVKWRRPKTAAWITKIGVSIAALTTLIWVIVWVYANPMFFVNTSWKLYVAAVTVMVVGTSSVGLVTYLLNSPLSIVKTVSIETSYQSVGTALTVSIISFERQVAVKVQGYIFLYCVTSTTMGTVFGGLYQLVKARSNYKIAATTVEEDS